MGEIEQIGTRRLKMEKEKNVGAIATTEKTGAEKATKIKKSFEELLQDKEYQSAFDKKITQSLQTAKVKWQEESKRKELEANRLAKVEENQARNKELEQEKERANKAESELHIYKIKERVIHEASQRGISIEYLDTIDFSKEREEDINKKLDIFEKVAKREQEKMIKEIANLLHFDVLQMVKFVGIPLQIYENG